MQKRTFSLFEVFDLEKVALERGRENLGKTTTAENIELDSEEPEKSRLGNVYTQVDGFQTFLTEHGHHATLLYVIVRVMLVFPMATNSAGVERVFSATSWLNDVLRNSMSDATLNA